MQAGNAASDAAAEALRARVAEVLAPHMDGLKALVAARVPNPHDAADVLQDALVEICRSIEKLDPTRDPGPWLRTIAIRAVQKHYRDRGRPARRSAELNELHEFLWARRAEHEETSLAEDARRLADLRDCMAGLDDEQRALLRLRYREGQPVAAIAAEAGKTVNAISKQLMALRGKLRACIERKRTERGR